VKKFIIKAKGSNTGNIHDIADSHADREITFGNGCDYAVVCAAYYGGNQHSSHKTGHAVAKVSKRLGGKSHKIIDADGVEHEIVQTANGDYLRSKHNPAT